MDLYLCFDYLEMYEKDLDKILELTEVFILTDLVYKIVLNLLSFSTYHSNAFSSCYKPHILGLGPANIYVFLTKMHALKSAYV